MKNRCMQVLLGVMLGLLVVPAHAIPVVTPAQAQPKKEKTIVELADSAVITYKKVTQLPTGPLDAVVHFSMQESAQDLKDQFAACSKHAQVAASIIPGIKNLLSVVTGWITELKSGTAAELTKTVRLSLADDKESVVATVVLRKIGTGKDQKITATITYVGFARDEPMFLHNLFHAVFVRDASSLSVLKALGFVAAGLTVVSGISRAVKGSWNPFAERGVDDDGRGGDVKSVFTTKDMNEFADLFVNDISQSEQKTASIDSGYIVKPVIRCTFDRTDFNFEKHDIAAGSIVVATVTSAEVLVDGEFCRKLSSLGCAQVYLIVPKSLLTAQAVSTELKNMTNQSFFVFDDENDSSTSEAYSDEDFSRIFSGLQGLFFAKPQKPKQGVFYVNSYKEERGVVVFSRCHIRDLQQFIELQGFFLQQICRFELEKRAADFSQFTGGIVIADELMESCSLEKPSVIIFEYKDFETVGDFLHKQPVDVVNTSLLLAVGNRIGDGVLQGFKTLAITSLVLDQDLYHFKIYSAEYNFNVDAILTAVQKMFSAQPGGSSGPGSGAGQVTHPSPGLVRGAGAYASEGGAGGGRCETMLKYWDDLLLSMNQSEGANPGGLRLHFEVFKAAYKMFIDSKSRLGLGNEPSYHAGRVSLHRNEIVSNVHHSFKADQVHVVVAFGSYLDAFNEDNQAEASKLLASVQNGIVIFVHSKNNSVGPCALLGYKQVFYKKSGNVMCSGGDDSDISTVLKWVCDIMKGEFSLFVFSDIASGSGSGVGASAVPGGAGGRRSTGAASGAGSGPAARPVTAPVSPAQPKDFFEELSAALVEAGIDMSKICLKKLSMYSDYVSNDRSKVFVIFDTVSHDPSQTLQAVQNGIIVKFDLSTEYYYGYYRCSNTTPVSLLFKNKWSEDTESADSKQVCIAGVIKCLNEHFAAALKS